MTVGVNPLVVSRLDEAGGKDPWSGIYLAEDIEALRQGIADGSWVDGTLGGVGAGLDTLGVITDPLGTLASWGVAWLLEHVRPLSQALDALAGDPGQVAAGAATWLRVSQQLGASGQDYRDSVSRDLAGWSGEARAGYQQHADGHVAAIEALSRASATMADAVQGAGELVAFVRTLVRDLIADFVSVLAVRLWEWLAEEGFTLGLATPWVVAQVSTLVARWVEKINHLFRALLESLTRLGKKLRELAHLVDNLGRRTLMRGNLTLQQIRGRAISDVDDLASPSRWNHILLGEGDRSNLAAANPGGGHLWPGLTGTKKTPFPAGWTPGQIKRNTVEVLTSPSSHWDLNPADYGPITKKGKPRRYVISGTVDGVALDVIWEPAGEGIISAYPRQ